ncbi:MAG: cytochrome c-type biogenesis protein [Gammaproteobacteria bacterium]
MRSGLLGLFLLFLPFWVGAIDPDAPIADEEQRLLYEDLITEVRCLVCQNQAIGDSTAPLAADLRREIRGMVEAGQSEGQIKNFLTDRYGEFVLYRPRYTGATAVLWIAPGALVLLGGVALWRVVRKRATLPVTSEEEDAMDA